jgi:antirestriction protein ArdC
MKAAEAIAGIVARLVAQIEAGATGWEMPWRNFSVAGWPTNAVSGRHYRGGNAIVLAVTAYTVGYPTARWATYKQWASIGAHVRRGERATTAIYWHAQPATDDGSASDDDDGQTAADVNGGPAAWARSFSVFNAAQIDNDPQPDTSRVDVDRVERDAVAEAWFANIPAAAVVGWGEGNPCYRPGVDRIVMPPFDAFDTAADAYATLAHELAHWTGHPSRLNRSFGVRFGDHAYAAEELVAELSAAFTCALVGIDTVARTDHAGYLAHWCQLLRRTPSALWSIAAKAQAATDLLDSYQPDAGEAP